MNGNVLSVACVMISGGNVTALLVIYQDACVKEAKLTVGSKRVTSSR